MAGLTGMMPMVAPPSFDAPTGHGLSREKQKILLAVIIGIVVAPVCFSVVIQVIIMVLATLGIAVGAVAAGHAH